MNSALCHSRGVLVADQSGCSPSGAHRKEYLAAGIPCGEAVFVLKGQHGFVSLVCCLFCDPPSGPVITEEREDCVHMFCTFACESGCNEGLGVFRLPNHIYHTTRTTRVLANMCETSCQLRRGCSAITPAVQASCGK